MSLLGGSHSTNGMAASCQFIKGDINKLHFNSIFIMLYLCDVKSIVYSLLHSPFAEFCDRFIIGIVNGLIICLQCAFVDLPLIGKCSYNGFVDLHSL